MKLAINSIIVTVAVLIFAEPDMGGGAYGSPSARGGEGSNSGGSGSGGGTPPPTPPPPGPPVLMPGTTVSSGTFSYDVPDFDDWAQKIAEERKKKGKETDPTPVVGVCSTRTDWKLTEVDVDPGIHKSKTDRCSGGGVVTGIANAMTLALGQKSEGFGSAGDNVPLCDVTAQSKAEGWRWENYTYTGGPHHEGLAEARYKLRAEGLARLKGGECAAAAVSLCAVEIVIDGKPAAQGEAFITEAASESKPQVIGTISLTVSKWGGSAGTTLVFTIGKRLSEPYDIDKDLVTLGKTQASSFELIFRTESFNQVWADGDAVTRASSDAYSFSHTFQSKCKLTDRATAQQ